MQSFIQDVFATPVNLLSALLALVGVIGGAVLIALNLKLFRLTIKNLSRNLLRTLLTGLAICVLVALVTLIWTVLLFLDKAMADKATDIKLIITERWQIPSQLPPTHAHYLDPENSKLLPELKGIITPGNYMSWSFYGGTTDPTKFSADNIVFFFCMDPRHIRSMMEDLQDLDAALVQKMVETKNGCLLGPERMAKLGKRVGERFKLTSMNYKGVDLDFEIVGELPAGRYGLSGIMNASYFNDELDKYARERRNPHPFDQKRLNLIWLRVPDSATFEKVGGIIEASEVFADRPVKVEKASSLIGNFFEPFRDLIFGFKYLVVPAILISMALVIANSISISVRERRTEIAVLKVLGFKPRQVLFLILGEAMLVGALAGVLTGGALWLFINTVIGGVPFPIAFFPRFLIPEIAFCWGFAIGLGTSFAGSITPAWNARSVKVSEVFSKVA